MEAFPPSWDQEAVPFFAGFGPRPGPLGVLGVFVRLWFPGWCLFRPSHRSRFEVCPALSALLLIAGDCRSTTSPQKTSPGRLNAALHAKVPTPPSFLSGWSRLAFPFSSPCFVRTKFLSSSQRRQWGKGTRRAHCPPFARLFCVAYGRSAFLARVASRPPRSPPQLFFLSPTQDFPGRLPRVSHTSSLPTKRLLFCSSASRQCSDFCPGVEDPPSQETSPSVPVVTTHPDPWQKDRPWAEVTLFAVSLTPGLPPPLPPFPSPPWTSPSTSPTGFPVKQRSLTDRFRVFCALSHRGDLTIPRFLSRFFPPPARVPLAPTPPVDALLSNNTQDLHAGPVLRAVFDNFCIFMCRCLARRFGHGWLTVFLPLFAPPVFL